mmetsp:Transcript_12276/g.37455  ORF Transcript_12276/g.37455 Transcript_12276/m.37455 type:complete len:278 (+) Transcript_12276:1605-2438(+)
MYFVTLLNSVHPSVQSERYTLGLNFRLTSAIRPPNNFPVRRMSSNWSFLPFLPVSNILPSIFIWRSTYLPTASRTCSSEVASINLLKTRSSCNIAAKIFAISLSLFVSFTSVMGVKTTQTTRTEDQSLTVPTFAGCFRRTTAATRSSSPFTLANVTMNPFPWMYRRQVKTSCESSDLIADSSPSASMFAVADVFSSSASLADGMSSSSKHVFLASSSRVIFNRLGGESAATSSMTAEKGFSPSIALWSTANFRRSLAPCTSSPIFFDSISPSSTTRW